MATLAARTMTLVTASANHQNDAVPVERLAGSQASTDQYQSVVFTRDPLLQGLEWLVFFGVLCLFGWILPVFASTAIAVVLGLVFAETWVQKIELDGDNRLKISTLARTRAFSVSDLPEVLFDRKVTYPTERWGTGVLRSAGAGAVLRFSSGSVAKLPFLGESEFRRLELFAQDLKSRNKNMKITVRYHYEPQLEGDP